MRGPEFSHSLHPDNSFRRPRTLSSSNLLKPVVGHIGLQDLSIGLVRELEWAIQSDEVDQFAGLSGDINPLHVDPEFARLKGFPDRVVHGFLLGAKVSAFVGTVMPGRDCLLLESQLAWPNPCFAGETVRLRGEITELSKENRAMRIKMRATVPRGGASVVVGRGWVLCQIRS
jgi:3-hydroxybutyryl-CoA dehydratase